MGIREQPAIPAVVDGVYSVHPLTYSHSNPKKWIVPTV